MSPADVVAVMVVIGAALLLLAAALETFKTPRVRSRRQRRKPVAAPRLGDLLEELTDCMRRLEASNERLRDVILRLEPPTLHPPTVDALPTRQPAIFRQPEVRETPPPARQREEPVGLGSGTAKKAALGLQELARLNSHIPAVVMTAVCVAAIVGILVFRGTETSIQSAMPPGLTAAQEAKILAARGDYEQAWRLYYKALRAAPRDVGLWYAMGVVLSQLNEQAATQEAFAYVVEHGKPDSQEVRQARQWLVSAGVLAEPVEFASDAPPVVGSVGVVTGTVSWGDPQPDRPVLRAQIVLERGNGAVSSKRFATRVLMGDDYRFEGVPAGSYRLVGQAAGRRLWELRLTVEDGREIIVNLDKQNSSDPTASLYL